MNHYCVFEVHSVGSPVFVDWFEDRVSALEFCVALNKCKNPLWKVTFCVSCLNDAEFENRDHYDPVLTSADLTNFQNTLLNVERSLRELNDTIRLENEVYKAELADRLAKNLIGSAAIQHYNDWMRSHNMEYLMVKED